MPALTTAMRLPCTACNRRDSTSGQRSSPFMVDAVPSVIESPKATIAKLIRRRHHLDGVDEEPRRRAVRKCCFVLRLAFRSRALRGDVGCGEGFRVPCHRAALARDVKADGELASGKLRRIAHETKLDAIAPDRAPRRHRHARFAA